MQNKEVTLFRLFFIAAALWNLLGAIFGYFNTAFTFQHFFGRELSDPLMYVIYKGAWGTTLVYFIGYFIVAFNPVRHPGIVIVGGVGKVSYAVKLLELYLTGIASPVVLIVVIGDFLFSFFFVYYFIRMFRTKEKIL